MRRHIEPRPLEKLSDLRWPVLGGFVGAVLAAVLLGDDLWAHIIALSGLVVAGLGLMSLSLGQPTRAGKVAAIVAITVGLFASQWGLGHEVGRAVAAALIGTPLLLAIRPFWAKYRWRG